MGSRLLWHTGHSRCRRDTEVILLTFLYWHPFPPSLQPLYSVFLNHVGLACLNLNSVMVYDLFIRILILHTSLARPLGLAIWCPEISKRFLHPRTDSIEHRQSSFTNITHSPLPREVHEAPLNHDTTICAVIQRMGNCYLTKRTIYKHVFATP